MDKNAIKKFAVWARRDLIERVAQKAAGYGITADEIISADADSIHGALLSDAVKRQRKALITEINEKGYEQVIEEVAYTWFNRLIALRFMEVNGYLPSHIRVFTNDDGAFRPQILSEAINLDPADWDGIDMERIYALKQDNKDEELFKYLLILQCNALNAVLPEMFEKIEHYTELLLPDYLLREGSVIEQMIALIPEDDWREQVQIIGWLYQYYNSEKKDAVFEAMKKNVKVSKDNIPAATQLFTPDWIVRYMVENSLGRLWVDGHADTSARAEWKYYLDEAEQTPEVQAQLAEIREGRKNLTPEQIRFIDPCMGSGHILVYAFDVLMQIYVSCGYSERDAAQSIVQHNLWGLDLDKRAYQLAYFALMMKARQYDRRFLTREIKPNLSHFQDLPQLNYALLDEPIRSFVQQFENADTYGSLISVQPIDGIDQAVDAFGSSLELNFTQLEHFMQLYKILSQRYDVVCTNPPYMGAGNMNSVLCDYLKDNYSDYKSDFFSAFVIRCTQLAKTDGYLGFLTPYVWMFIQSYEKLRQELYTNRTIETLIQFEYSAFEEATVPICTFAFRNNHIRNKNGCYLRLTDFRGGMEIQRQKALEAIANHNCGFYYEAQTENFSMIPGSPVAFWVSDNFFKAFDNPKFSERFVSGGRNKTHGNEKYVRTWWEVIKSERWQGYANGGSFRKWYGNNIDVVDWSESARASYDEHGGLLRIEYWDVLGITWSAITSSKVGYRIKPVHSKFSSASPTLICKNKQFDYTMLGFLNSKVCEVMNAITNPTLNTLVGNILLLPDIIHDVNANDIVTKCVELCESDWDSFETSWDFKRHPLI